MWDLFGALIIYTLKQSSDTKPTWNIGRKLELTFLNEMKRQTYNLFFPYSGM